MPLINKSNDHICVIGTGIIGTGIALDFALSDYKVKLISRTKEGIIKAKNLINNDLKFLLKINKINNSDLETIKRKIKYFSSMKNSIKDCPLIIESIYENLNDKISIFSQIDKISDPEAIITSSTSSFLPEEFQLSSTRRKKILLTHYINPPYIIPLVEIVPGNDTADKTIYEVYDLLKSINKKPVILNQPIPGFISVRLQVALLREALYLIDNNLANAKQIDDVIKFSIGRRWAISGLLKTLDLGGWDIQSSIYDTLASKLSNSINTPNILNTKIKEKKLGVKSQEGFYKWTKEEINEIKTNIAKISYYIDNL
ncbi:MAG: hypothetical protein CL758_08595 [Chloroflexi bacterium]|nr:hypothetical protein [Chloroflexota bacterium]|tara:strand:- start:8450 stop:9391 length:942 start_codon:yes stop_codon:yes gene_type:complete